MPRRRRIITPRSRFFFGCEGASERAFAVFLQKICENLGLHIHLDVHSLGGGDPLSLVCEAIGKRNRQRARRGRFRQSLLLLDSDRFVPEDQRCRRASTLAQAEGIKLIVLINPLRDVIMRTTLTLDNDVIDKARAVAAKHRLTFRAVVNEALRIGLEEVEKSATRRPYRTEPHAMGLRAGYNLDNIQEVLPQAEGEDFR